MDMVNKSRTAGNLALSVGYHRETNRPGQTLNHLTVATAVQETADSAERQAQQYSRHEQIADFQD